MLLNPETLKEIADALKRDSEYAKNQDVARFFAALVDHVKAIEPELAKKLSTSLASFTGIVTKAEARLDKRIDTAAGDAQKALRNVVKAFDAAINAINQDTKHFVTGLALQSAFDAFRESLPPPLPPPEDFTPVLLDRLQELEDEIEELKKRPAQVSQQPGTHTTIIAQARGTVKVYDLSDQLNGIKKTFALPAFWRVLSVQSTSAPVIFRPDVDYTVDAAAMTLTFTDQIDAASTLTAGQTLLVTYAEN